MRPKTAAAARLPSVSSVIKNKRLTGSFKARQAFFLLSPARFGGRPAQPSASGGGAGGCTGGGFGISLSW